MNNNNNPILLIDDNISIRESLVWIMEQQGCAIITANNGQEALEMLHSGMNPAIIFLDLMMPIMDGYLFRQLQNANPLLSTIPTVIISASGHENKITLLPNEQFLQKPFDILKLLEIIKKYCDE